MDQEKNSLEEIEKAIEESILTRNTGKLVKLLEDEKGKKIIIDVAQLQTQLIPMEKWIDYFSGVGLCFINTKKNDQTQG